MLVVDGSGLIRFCNRGATFLFGYTKEELLHTDIEALVPSKLRAEHVFFRDEFMKQPASRAMGVGRDLCAVRKDGTAISVEVALTPMAVEQESLVIAIVVDITERRRLEAQLREAHRELEQRVRERTCELERANAEKEALLSHLELKQAELQRLSREDPLTRLSNRRDFDLRLGDAIAMAKRDGRPLSVAMFDLDYFKNVNDSYGHAIGDAVLRQTAEIIRSECRVVDIVARYGGEEFAVAFPNADTNAARAICDRIRVAFQRFSWGTIAPGLSLTISAGAAILHSGMDASEFLARADANLYVAKRGGRNRVETTCAVTA